MSLEDGIKKTIIYYRDLLKEKGIQPENFSEEENWKTMPSSKRLSHALWMAEELLKPTTTHYSTDKRSRWTGFIQGIIILEGITNVRQECNRTRPWLTDHETAK